MKMLNTVAPSKTPRWDMMTEVKKMQITLDRMYTELDPIATRAETDAIKVSIANLNYLLMKLNNARTPVAGGLEAVV